jgi:hypothetical protein
MLEAVISQRINELKLKQSRELIAEIRAYLDKQDRTVGTGNSVFQLLRRKPDRDGLVQINLGIPSIDRTSSAFGLRSGSRLTFGITVRDDAQHANLIAYRFQIQFPDRYSPAYLRFDLIPRQHEVPLRESRCHLHPGSSDIRIPIPVLSPFDILDRIFFVIEPSIR